MDRRLLCQYSKATFLLSSWYPLTYETERIYDGIGKLLKWGANKMRGFCSVCCQTHFFCGLFCFYLVFQTQNGYLFWVGCNFSKEFEHSLNTPEKSGKDKYMPPHMWVKLWLIFWFLWRRSFPRRKPSHLFLGSWLWSAYRSLRLCSVSWLWYKFSLASRLRLIDLWMRTAMNSEQAISPCHRIFTPSYTLIRTRCIWWK